MAQLLLKYVEDLHETSSRKTTKCAESKTKMPNRKTGSLKAAKEIGIDIHRLYRWEGYGIVNPTKIMCGTREFRRYSDEDISRGRLIRMLTDEEGYVLRAAVRKLEEREQSSKTQETSTRNRGRPSGGIRKRYR